jgi:uncharacterized phage protein (TIGR01671 family)
MRDTRNIRAWDDIAKHMSYGKIVQYDDMLGYRFDHFETETPVYMWSTGLKDRNGKDIFEGDILQDEEAIGEVEWVQEHCAFQVFARNPSRYHQIESDGVLKYTEVIGNIHQHPHLLGGNQA